MLIYTNPTELFALPLSFLAVTYLSMLLQDHGGNIVFVGKDGSGILLKSDY